MKRFFVGMSVLVLAAVLSQGAFAQTASPVGQALEEEIARAMTLLSEKGDPVPYFISYQVHEIRSVDIMATRGTLRDTRNALDRVLDVEVRVGDYEFDNTHQIRGQRGAPSANARIPSIRMPLDNDVDALKSVIWQETDRRYRAAVERYIQARANTAIRVEVQDTSADFSRESVETTKLPLVAVDVDVDAWEEKARQYSALFARHPELLEGQANLSAVAGNQYFVTSEGTSVAHGTVQVRLGLYARVKAEDGMDLFRFESFDAHTVDGLPADDVVEQTIEKMIADLKALLTAPLIEPFTGPAILSGRASGVFFHEIFGHRMEGHRQRNENEGQTFTRQLDQLVLPDFLSIVDDPTRKQIGGTDLNGYYVFDDEGVQAQPVTIVENGILRSFLLSRLPVAGFEQSNGHGRKQPGYPAVARQANLIIEASNTVNDDELRRLLIEEARRQGREFGLYFADISGGFTTTGRSSPQAFQVTPIMVYRIYVDGRPDELVRGVDMIGTPLTAFSKIVAAGDTLEIFNGYCGAESGYVPVAAVSPSILTTQIEVQLKPKSSERLPILPPPTLLLGEGL